MSNYDYRSESIFQDHEEDYENVESNSLIAGMYSQFAISNCARGGVILPKENDQF